jgi:hypothetical protein
MTLPDNPFIAYLNHFFFQNENAITLVWSSLVGGGSWCTWFPSVTCLAKLIRLLNQEIQQDELDFYTREVENLQLVGGVIWKCLAKSVLVDCCSPGQLHFSTSNL